MREKRALLCAAALAVTVLLILKFPDLPVSRQEDGAAQRRLITVWLAKGLPGTSAWAREQAAVFDRNRKAAGVWLRTVTEGEMAALADAPPDVILWAAGTRLPEALSLEEARPLCLSGYVLAQPLAEAPITPAPRSLFGVSPTPDPAQTPAPAVLAWPETFWADEGFGALALRSLGNPEGARFAPADQLPGHMRKGAAALISLAQARRLEIGYQVVAAAPATDLVLYAALTPGASPEARQFVEHLLSPAAQTALANQGLLPALSGLRLYGPEAPAACALQFALAEGWLAPPDWAEEQTLQTWTAQALYGQ